MRVRSSVLSLVLIAAASIAPAQTPSSGLTRIAEAERLLADETHTTMNAAFGALGNPGAADGFERASAASQARITAFLKELQIQIARTPRETQPGEWGALYIAMSIAQEGEMFSGGEMTGPRTAIDAALTTLTRENAPYIWARAQLQRGHLLLFEMSNDDGSTNTMALQSMMRAAAAARSVFTRQDYPREYLQVQCQLREDGFEENPSAETQLRLAALEPTCANGAGMVFTGMSRGDSRKIVVQQFNAALMMEPMAQQIAGQSAAYPKPHFGPFAGGARKQYDAQMKQAQDSIQQAAEQMRAQSDGGALVDQISENRAAFLSAALSMERLGLESAALARARVLRAHADALAAQTPAAALRENVEYWRASAELHDIIAAAAPPPAAPVTVDDPVIALLTLTETRGYAAVKPRAGQGAVFATETNKEGIRLTTESMQRPKYSYNPLPVFSLFSTLNMGNQIKQEQKKSEENQRKLTAESTALMASAESSPAEAWTRMYAAGDFPAAIDDFRKRFEPQFSPMLHAAAASAVQSGGRIIIMPDGAGSMLPIALLRDPKTGRALIEDYEIAYTPSLAAYDGARRRAQSASAPALAVVAPSFAESGLEFIESEAALAREPFGAGIAVTARTKPDLLGQLSRASYWHFATHGFFDPQNPRASRLQIPGGAWLTLGDLLFSETALGAPRLVVLSACESGLFDTTADPDQFVGMPTGFLQAGAAGVIATLWPVSDVSATLLMAQFYDRHRRGGERPSAALRHAQLWLKESDKPTLTAWVRAAQARGALTPQQADGLISAIEAEPAAKPYAHPYHWGAFVYYGA